MKPCGDILVSFIKPWAVQAAGQPFPNFFFACPKKKLQKEKTRQVKKSLSMTLIPAKRQNSFGCASLRQLPFLTPEYRDGLRLFFNAGIDFAYYGYNAANTRSYKLSMLNMHQWVNGQPQSIQLQLQQAMFYPNAYINFNHNGEYTKHYYNGTERIASRLGNATLNITTTANSRLTSRTTHADNRFQTDVQDLVDEDIPLNNAGQAAGYTPIPLTSLAVTGTSSDIFYYHTNHLGSTAFVTDQNQTITQGFLYAPFGEITTEFNATFGNDVLPKYSFNAKELDEETGMYYYEARYYKPPVFASRDAMFEKYFWMTPYAYCANNPVKYVDPSGEDWLEREVDGRTEVFYDRRVSSQSDLDKHYKNNSGVKLLEDGSKVGNGQYTVYNRDGGVMTDAQGNVVNPDKTIIYGENYTLFAGVTDQSLDPTSLHKNMFGSSYIGSNNPACYGKDEKGNKIENYDYKPTWSPTEMAAYQHDKAYDKAGVKGISGVLFSKKVIKDDMRLAITCFKIALNPTISEIERKHAATIGVTFGGIAILKKILNQ